MQIYDRSISQGNLQRSKEVGHSPDVIVRLDLRVHLVSMANIDVPIPLTRQYEHNARKPLSFNLVITTSRWSSSVTQMRIVKFLVTRPMVAAYQSLNHQREVYMLYVHVCTCVYNMKFKSKSCLCLFEFLGLLPLR